MSFNEIVHQTARSQGRRVVTIPLPLAPIIALAILLFGIKGFYFDLAFQFGKTTSRQLWISAAAAIVVTILNLLWIPKYGAMGAAWATVVAFALGLLLSAIWGRSSFRLPWPVAAWGRIVLATGVMSVALLPIRGRSGATALLMQLCLGVVVYGGVAFLLDIGGTRRRVHL